MTIEIIDVLPNKSALIKRSKEIVLERLHKALESRDKFTLALSGGSTPKPLYEALSQEALPWSKIHVFWGDERYVAATDKDSNQLMARQAWLDRVDIPASNIHPIKTEAKNPQQDAQQHERELHEFFQTQPGEFPTFDLILLGMGDDGHTASLFPHTEALSVQDRLVTVGNKDGQPRITFTAPLINQARCALFIIAGENKRPALKEIFADDTDTMQYPARLIKPKEELLWLLDRSAGEKLQ